jgi:hypothetical protein
MAWNATNPVTVGAATKKDHYDRAFDNLLELRAGGIAIASQAAGDFLYATSATQMGRKAKGTGLQVPRINAGATDWEFADVTDVAARAGGISIASQAALDFLYASGASQFARLAAGGALTYPRINAAGTGWEFAAVPVEPLDLLYSNSGTGGVRTIDTYAISGLTVQDILELELDIIKVGGTGVSVKFTNTTDSVDITANQTANADTHTVFSHRVSAGPISLTDVQSSGRRTASGTITNNAVASTFTTNWTGNWTTGLIVDSGDGTSVDWVVRIYKRKGQ